MNEKGNTPTLDYLRSLIIEPDVEELADWTEDEYHLCMHLLEREGISSEDCEEILDNLSSIAVMEIAGADFEFGPGEYWRKVREILSKYPKIQELIQESEAKRIFAFHWEKRKDSDECCRYFVEDYVFSDGDQPPYDIRACTHPENDPCAGSEGYSGFCCIHCPEEDDCDHKCPPLRRWLERYSEGEIHNLEETAEECQYSEWDAADCNHSPDCTFLRCTLESKKPCCPESGICCAQCSLISTCVLACPQFEGMVDE